ncbi:flagellar hook-associated protein FlgL [Marinomonas balearica]|uniref:Flagellar hook-associated protein 3 FlgL n=1 Tax=Marinomonas balearica TaxID=491947 RepID=A0A4R6M7W0_9GAMM|nr:flagellar hook-associated protein FlgL [Marinomonas balearica]TDO96219.1 flagellar hook-associated protein 3 FlgL [Marinomonas balearica]
MRVTNHTMYTQTAQSLLKANERYLKINEKIAEESNIVRPSDDPNGAGQVLNYQAENALNDQYEKTMTLAKNALDYEEVSLESLNTSMDSANVLLIQAQNSAYSTADLSSIADELSLIVESMADLMNSKDAGGNYIFSGSDSSSPTMSLNGSGEYVYGGNETQNKAQIADGVSIPVNDTGKKIFQDVWTRNTFSASVTAGGATLTSLVDDQDAYNRFVDENYDAITPANNTYTLTSTVGTPNSYSFTDASGNVVDSGTYQDGNEINVNGMSFSLDSAGATVSVTLDTPTRDNVLNELNDTISVLQDPNATDAERTAALRNATESIENTQETVGTAISEVGSRKNTISSRESYIASKEISNELAMNEIAGIDVSEAATELQSANSAISATQSLFTRLANLSLFNSL